MNTRIVISPKEKDLIFEILENFDASFYNAKKYECYTKTYGNLVHFQYKEEEDGAATVHVTIAPEVTEKLLRVGASIAPAIKGIAKTMMNLAADIKNMPELQKDKCEIMKVMKKPEYAKLKDFKVADRNDQ